jgi:mono/diheme cytochrome c family protein
MKRGMMWVGALVVGMLVLLGSVVAFGVVAADRKASRQIAVSIPPIARYDDAIHLARGSHLYASRGCAECHGADGAGGECIKDPSGLRVVAPNLTPGEQSAVGTYSAVDWVRSIRHGVAPSGRPLLIMPSEDYARLGDEDMASLVSFLQTLPPRSGPVRDIEMPLIMRVLYGFDVIEDAAQKINHTLAAPVPPPRVADATYGAYVAQTCVGCHGPGFSGGQVPSGAPSWPPAANLTPGEGSVMGCYATVADFRSMLRTGMRPNGTEIHPAMPFASLRQLDDLEVEALYAFLQTLAPRPHGQR